MRQNVRNTGESAVTPCIVGLASGLVVSIGANASLTQTIFIAAALAILLILAHKIDRKHMRAENAHREFETPKVGMTPRR